MKYLTEFRDPEKVKQWLDRIHQITTKEWTLMEVCGGQTHSLVKNGILDLLPKNINMVHGPGCPVCVTPLNLIDQAIDLAMRENVILCTFGDMIRVPGSKKSLLEAKAEGANVRIMYSPLEAVKLAEQETDKEIVFFAVGFETTAPANAFSVFQAHMKGISNYSILASHVLVPPAIKAIMDDPLTRVQAFLAAGHVCTIMGTDEYHPLSRKYRIPIVVTGFEPVDLLQGIYMAVHQLENGIYKVENQYSRVVLDEGNQKAQELIGQVFRTSDRIWRGIDLIPESGYELRAHYRDFDARHKFNLAESPSLEDKTCISGEIMKGLAKPPDCKNFGCKCTPENPLGAPMVSSEGACAAYYHYSSELIHHE